MRLPTGYWRPKNRFGEDLVADPKTDGQPHSCLFLSFYILRRIGVR